MLTSTAPVPATTCERAFANLDDAVSVFTDLRPRLLAIAHRILADRAEAEDTVQDAWVRWQLCDRAAVVNPTAFLVTMVTRLALNTKASARVRRESYADQWLPERADSAADPTTATEQNEALGGAIDLLMERLAPSERAAYVLRHAFDYPYERIGQILHLTDTNTRQTVCRAGKRLGGDRRRKVTRDERRELLEVFVAAARDGAIAALENLFATEAPGTPALKAA